MIILYSSVILVLEKALEDIICHYILCAGIPIILEA